ncbi:MAG TPA: ATP-binding protein [Candidatus Acidoferrum sp.]|jgi:heavy metal sensor kinase
MLDSVRVRLTLWYGGGLALALILLSVLTYFLYARNISQRTDNNLAELSDAFATTFNAEVPDHSGPDRVKSAAEQAMLEHRFSEIVFALTDTNGKVILSSLELPAVGKAKETFSPQVFSSDEFRELAVRGLSGRALQTIPGGRHGFRGFARPLFAEGNTYSLVQLQSRHVQAEMLEDIRNTFLWAIPIILLCATAGGYFLARKSLAPVTAMASQARGMGASNLSDRLSVSNQRDELGQLALSFNQLLDRLEESFERQRRFISDASHELRTPVAILRGETEVTLARENRSPGEYRETLKILRDESQRLAHIIEDLFTLTRADAGQYPLTLRDFYLDEMTSDVIRHARSLALTKNIALTSSVEPELLVHGDEALIRRLLLNLLDNSFKYTPEGGKVVVECRKRGSETLLSVADSGPGIPQDLHERVFERFFRVDKARSRSESDTGGAGLGLAIARWIAEAHHGRLELTRSDSSGTTFSAYLPGAPV